MLKLRVLPVIFSKIILSGKELVLIDKYRMKRYRLRDLFYRIDPVPVLIRIIRERDCRSQGRLYSADAHNEFIDISVDRIEALAADDSVIGQEQALMVTLLIADIIKLYGPYGILTAHFIRVGNVRSSEHESVVLRKITGLRLTIIKLSVDQISALGNVLFVQDKIAVRVSLQLCIDTELPVIVIKILRTRSVIVHAVIEIALGNPLIVQGEAYLKIFISCFKRRLRLFLVPLPFSRVKCVLVIIFFELAVVGYLAEIAAFAECAALDSLQTFGECNLFKVHTLPESARFDLGHLFAQSDLGDPAAFAGIGGYCCE